LGNSAYYHLTLLPQASQVQRFNCNLKAALTIYHNSQHTRWDEYLPSLALAFNSALHESTAAIPASLFLGRELNHHLGLKWKLCEMKIDKYTKSIQEFWQTALSNLRKTRGILAERHNQGRRQVDVRAGDLIQVRLHSLCSRSLQSSAKLDYVWSVPLKIVRFISPVTVLLANPETGVIVRKAHVFQEKGKFQGNNCTESNGIGFY
jgi:hypothetical protein